MEGNIKDKRTGGRHQNRRIWGQVPLANEVAMINIATYHTKTKKKRHEQHVKLICGLAKTV